MPHLRLLSNVVLFIFISVSLALVSKRPYEKRTFFLNSDAIHFPKDSDEITPERPRDSGYSYPSIIFPKSPTSEEDSVHVNNRKTFESNGRTVPVEVARQLAGSEDINDLINKHFEDPEKVLSMTHNVLTVQSRFGDEPSSEPGIKASYPSLAMCKALPEVVSLEPANLPTDTRYIPECTRVPRCGGCCVADVLKCEPTEVEMRTFNVLESKYFSNVSKFKFVAIREVQVEEHKKCACACRMKEDCNEKQEFDESLCECSCRNLDEELQCSPKVHYWDEKTCQCVCRHQLSCSGSRHFDNKQCRCIRGKGYNVAIVDLS